MRRPSILLSVVLVLSGSLACKDGPAPQSRVDWLRDNAVRLRTVDPTDEQFDDLQPLKRILGDARIVQLGEQSHGDGTTFDAKIRLIKFLHREMGFDVLAFESGLYDCRRAWQAFRAGEDPQSAAELGIFGIWTRSRQLEPLFTYLAASAASERPLELAGFDCQFTARGSRESLVPELRERVIGTDPARLTEDEAEALAVLLRWLGEPREPLADERRVAGLAALSRLEEALAGTGATSELPTRELAFWRQFLRSTRAYVDVARGYAEGATGGPESINARDAQMAENLLWLANDYYPGRRIIVWAATMHVQHNAETIDTRIDGFDYAEVVTMGQHVWKALRSEAYTLGFVAYAGQAGAAGREPRLIQPAPPDSLEALCSEAGLDNAVIDFRGLPDDSWLHEPLVSRPLGHTLMEASWPAVLDGVVFTRRMVPSTAR